MFSSVILGVISDMKGDLIIFIALMLSIHFITYFFKSLKRSAFEATLTESEKKRIARYRRNREIYAYARSRTKRF